MTDLDAATTTRPAPPELVKPCGYCTGNIIWMQLASGRARTFEPVEIFTASAPPEDDLSDLDLVEEVGQTQNMGIFGGAN